MTGQVIPVVQLSLVPLMRRWCKDARHVYQHDGGGLSPAPTLHFSADWRARTSVRPCEIHEINHLIRAHYLRRRPGVVTFCVVMETDGIAIGMVMYALPPRETSVRYGGPTWELARLFITDEAPCNSESWLIAQSIRFVKLFHPSVENLVSYADPSVGHVGTVYKASNWIADGRTDDERKSPRCDYVDTRTGKRYSRRAHLPDGATVQRVPRVSKFRFLYPLKNRKRVAA